MPLVRAVTESSGSQLSLLQVRENKAPEGYVKRPS